MVTAIIKFVPPLWRLIPNQQGSYHKPSGQPKTALRAAYRKPPGPGLQGSLSQVFGAAYRKPSGQPNTNPMRQPKTSPQGILRPRKYRQWPDRWTIKTGHTSEGHPVSLA